MKNRLEMTQSITALRMFGVKRKMLAKLFGRGNTTITDWVNEFLGKQQNKETLKKEYVEYGSDRERTICHEIEVDRQSSNYLDLINHFLTANGSVGVIWIESIDDCWIKDKTKAGGQWVIFSSSDLEKEFEIKNGRSKKMRESKRAPLLGIEYGIYSFVFALRALKIEDNKIYKWCINTLHFNEKNDLGDDEQCPEDRDYFDEAFKDIVFDKALERQYFTFRDEKKLLLIDNIKNLVNSESQGFIYIEKYKQVSKDRSNWMVIHRKKDASFFLKEPSYKKLGLL